MPYQPAPFDDVARVAALRRYGAADDPVVNDLAALTRLAAAICEAPIAWVNLTDANRVVMPAAFGHGTGEVPREWSLCEQVVRSGRSMHTANLLEEPAWAGHPVVHGDPVLARMYASAPMITPDGHTIGTVCVLDPISRRLDDRQLAALQDLADTAVHLLEARSRTTELQAALGELAVRASHDALTGVANRDQVLEVLEAHAAERTRHTVLFCDLDGFKPINDYYGHGIGDQALAAVGARLRAATRPDDIVARVGGDEFVVVIPGINAATAESVAARIEDLVSRPIMTDSGPVTLGVSVGWALSRKDESAQDLLQRADHAMYAIKAARQELRAARYGTAV